MNDVTYTEKIFVETSLGVYLVACIAVLFYGVKQLWLDYIEKQETNILTWAILWIMVITNCLTSCTDIVLIWVSIYFIRLNDFHYLLPWLWS